MNYFEKANNLYNLKEYTKAINLYKQSIKIKENEAASLYNSAVCFIKLKKYTEAIPLLKSAISLKNDSKYYFNLGYCYVMLRNNQKALLHFNTAWALNHDDKDCEKAIKTILSRYKNKNN